MSVRQLRMFHSGDSASISSVVLVFTMARELWWYINSIDASFRRQRHASKIGRLYAGCVTACIRDVGAQCASKTKGQTPTPPRR